MELNLKKPIIFFDLETTGTNILHDRIVEICCTKVHPNGKEESKCRRLNPEMPIPPEATAVHHITDDDVKDMPTFRQVANSMKQFFEGCDLAGFNSNKFDVPMLIEEFHRVGIDLDLSKCKLVDVQNIYHKLEPRTLVAAYKYYCHKDLEEGINVEGHDVKAHSALADVTATYEVLKAQLDKYPDILNNDIGELAEFSKRGNVVDFAGRMAYNDNGEIIFNFGKYKGRTVFDVFSQDPSYYDWMQRGDFSFDTKHKLTQLYLEFKQSRK